MICPNCGTNNEDGAVFCANCGTSLAAAPQESVQPEVQPEQVYGQTPEYGQAPVYGQTPEYGQAPVYGQPQQPKKEFKLPFKITKKFIIISASVVAAIIAIIVFFCVGNSITDPNKTAMEYVKAVEQCNWDKAYDNLLLPKSEFLSKQAFIAAHADATGEQVTNIKAVKGYSSAGNLKNNKAIKVIYSTPSSVAEEVDLVLTVDNSHYMLFFKKYKVSSDGLVVKDCKINAPKGATLMVNGVEVADSYLSKESDKSSYDVYVIPYLFYGYNQVSVVTDITEPYETDFYAWEDEYSTSVGTYNIEYSEEAIDDLEEQAVSDMEKIIKAAQTNANYSSISDLVMSSAQSDMQSEYKSLASTFNPSNKTITNFKTKDMTASVTSTNYSVNSTDGCPMLRVTVKFSYSNNYQYNSSSSSTAKLYENSRSTSPTLYYKYEDGKWKLYDMSIYMSLS